MRIIAVRLLQFGIGKKIILFINAAIPLRIQDWAHSDPMSAAARTLWAPGSLR